MNRLLFFLLLLFYGGCYNSNVPDRVREAIAKSDRQLTLEKVISYYQDTGDSLKLKAAYFLLQNMPGLGSEQVRIRSDSGVISYNDYLKLSKRPDTLDAFYESQFVEDIEQISAEYLIDNIESAFAIWQNVQWRDEVDFESFCQYILPYRFAYEPLEHWRDSVHQQYQWIVDSIKAKESLAKVCSLINDDIRSWFVYASTQDASDLLLSYNELRRMKMGSCLGFTGINTFAMRAFGIPAMVDYVPYWADANGGHSWNAIMIKDKLFGLLWETGLSDKQALFPYDEKEDTIHHTFRRSGKIYRKVFGIEKASLAETCKDIELIPPLFRNNRLRDVTEEYIPVSDIRIELNQKQRSEYAYLCVFNGGQWEGVDWSNISNNWVTFQNVGRDVIYLISRYEHGRYVPVSKPFHLTSEGKIVSLETNANQPITLLLRKRSNDVYISYPEYEIMPGKRYLLYHWQDDDWHLLDKKIAFSDTIVFPNTPSGGLYRLKMYDSNNKERIFLYRDGQQIWR